MRYYGDAKYFHLGITNINSYMDHNEKDIVECCGCRMAHPICSQIGTQPIWRVDPTVDPMFGCLQLFLFGLLLYLHLLRAFSFKRYTLKQFILSGIKYQHEFSSGR